MCRIVPFNSDLVGIFSLLQEEYIKDEMKNLKRELIRAKEEIKRIQSVPLVIGQFNEIIDANYGIVGQFRACLIDRSMSLWSDLGVLPRSFDVCSEKRFNGWPSCRFDSGLKLLRAYSQHAGSRDSQAEYLGSSSPSQSQRRGNIAARERLHHSAHAREA